MIRLLRPALAPAARRVLKSWFSRSEIKIILDDAFRDYDRQRPGIPREKGAGARLMVGSAAPPPAGPGSYTCPMHPEIRQAGPGSCPKCGMALEPLLPAESKPVAEYTCPMHPKVVRDAPGSCPICGMSLEPRVPRRTPSSGT